MIALMISSQILLMGFVSYWLTSQYKIETAQLKAQITHDIYTVYDLLLDSMLMEYLIQPTLNDSMMIKLNLPEMSTLHGGTDSVHASVIIKHLDPDTALKPEGEERMVRSVKLFINETDAAFRANSEAHVFSMDLDSLEILEMLNETFLGKDWSFKVSWLDKNAHPASKKSLPGLVIPIEAQADLPFLHVEHITPHLLGLLFPQFLFALFLISLSASALILVYRSLKKQLVLNELRNDFISNISHELKTPVSTVKIALEALGTFNLKDDPKVSGEYIQMATREAERLESLVGKVLNHQVLEDPLAVIQKEPCDLQDLVRNVLNTLEIPIREREATVEVQSPEEPCLVMADPVYMESVVLNLIDNSLKYAGPQADILVEIDCKAREKLLKVKDKGPGIPEEYRDQIYQKFFRIPTGDHHNVKGYGLGLNFASRVMADLGGSISFRNLPQGGCEFILKFPRKP